MYDTLAYLTGSIRIMTRNYDNLVPFHARLTVTKNSLRTIGPNIWNSIPTEMKNVLTKNQLKTQYTKYLISLYNLSS